MTRERFESLLSEEINTYKALLETADNDWIVKGFVDVNKNIYTITNDTKVVSKIIELLLVPKLEAFSHANGLVLELPSRQNYYPDMTFKDEEGNLFAVDFKSSYYENDTVNGLTLGSYWGYFRERDTIKNMDYTYNSYCSHLVIGILYKRSNGCDNGKVVYSIEDLPEIKSVIDNFLFFVQPKWRIANDTPGSGNTRNIGGVTDIQKLVNGQGPFAKLGEDVFDDYWINYFNKADAQVAGIGTPHYTSLKTYKEYLESQANKLHKL